MVTQRILHNVGLINLVPTNLFAAHPHSSTVHAGLALTHDITTAHAAGPRRGRLPQLLLTVRYPKVLTTSTHQPRGDFPKISYRWLTSFLAVRVVELKFNGSTSDPDPIDIAPQSTLIYPILSSIYTFPLLQQANQWSDSHLYMYVDDGNIPTLALGPLIPPEPVLLLKATRPML